MLFSREKPLVKSTAPGSIFYRICFPVYLLPYLFSDLLLQKPKNTLPHFFFTYFISCFIQFYLSKLPQTNLSFYHGGIDNPSYALGCKYLFFVCRYRLHSVAWFSYWIDTLVSQLREIPTIVVPHHPFLFGKIPTQFQATLISHENFNFVSSISIFVYSCPLKSLSVRVHDK